MSLVVLVIALVLLAAYIGFELIQTLRGLILACPQCSATMVKRGQELICHGCGCVVTTGRGAHVD